MNVWLKRALIAVPLLVALFFGAILFYVNVIREDQPDALTTDDLTAIVTGSTAGEATDPTVAATTAATTVDTADTVPAADTVDTVDTVAATTAPAASAVATSDAVTTTVVADTAGSFDGTWSATADSVFGYRVEEVLFGVNTEAVGRGSTITGEVVITGTQVESGTFTVDVSSIVSDDERRDAQFRDNIMEVEQFPEATFTLTAPIELGSLPEAGGTITATATGDLTLHGVTQSVTFDVTAEATADRFGVLGNIPVLFADYDVDNPSRSGITTEDNGLLEFVLAFERA